MDGLLLHCGSQAARLTDIESVPTPAPSAAYETADLSDAEAHDFMIEALRARALPPSRIACVIDAWHRSDRSRNLWALFNAFTEALRGTVELSELARRTEKLHGLADLRAQKILGLPAGAMAPKNGNGASHAHLVESSLLDPPAINLEP